MGTDLHNRAYLYFLAFFEDKGREPYYLSPGCYMHIKQLIFKSTHSGVLYSKRVHFFSSAIQYFPGIKRSYTFGPAGGGYEDPVQ